MKKIIIATIIGILTIGGIIAYTTHASSVTTSEHPSNYIVRSNSSGLIEGTVYGMDVTTNLSNFGTAFTLLPSQIQEKCIQSYKEIVGSNKTKLNYGGIIVTHPSDSTWTFTWDKNTIKVTASQVELDKIFKYND